MLKLRQSTGEDMVARLPTPGGDNNNWGTVLNDYLQQALASDGKLVTAATNPYTGSANTNLATGSVPGLVQLTGDLAGSATSPALANIITAGGPIGSTTQVPIITWDAKGRLTAVSSATISAGSASRTFPFFVG